MYDMLLCQNHWTQIVQKIEIFVFCQNSVQRNHDKFYHGFAVMQSQKFRVQFDINFRLSIYKNDVLYFVSNELKCSNFRRRRCRNFVIKTWCFRTFHIKSKQFVHNLLLKNCVRLFVDSLPLQHGFSFSNKWSNWTSKSNFETIFPKLCQLSAKWLNLMIIYN